MITHKYKHNKTGVIIQNVFYRRGYNCCSYNYITVHYKPLIKWLLTVLLNAKQGDCAEIKVSYNNKALKISF